MHVVACPEPDKNIFEVRGVGSQPIPAGTRVSAKGHCKPDIQIAGFPKALRFSIFGHVPSHSHGVASFDRMWVPHAIGNDFVQTERPAHFVLSDLSCRLSGTEVSEPRLRL